MTYSVQDAREHFGEILQKAQSGERIVIVEEGREVVEIMGLPPKPDSMEEGYRQLVEEGVIVPSAGPRGELAPIVDAPGTLARFLESRD